MIGVVLWSDPQECKAVIWCEDHGDLAFYNDVCRHPCGVHDLDAGDLVEFDVEHSETLRYAHNPRVLQEGACSNLTDVLAKQPGVAGAPAYSVSAKTQTAEVIPLHKPVNKTLSPQVATKVG